MDLDQRAKDVGVPAIVSCGIWPGVSALMAAEAVSQLKERLSSNDEEEVDIESIDYSFFTAGTGNAGPTIVSATFLLLATPVITFLNGKRKDVEPWTEVRDIDFGKGIGNKPVGYSTILTCLQLLCTLQKMANHQIAPLVLVPIRCHGITSSGQ